MKELRKDNYSRFVIGNLARFSLSALLGIVLVGESVNAIARSEDLQIAQQQAIDNKEPIRKQVLKLIQEGRQLSKQGTAESSKQAISKWKQALQLLQQLGELKSSQAVLLYSIGNTYSNLGDKQQALKYYNQALPLAREIKDKLSEASILNNIAAIHDDLGDKQQALKVYNQALLLSRGIEDKGAEATIINNIGGIYNHLGDKQQALKFYKQALIIIREIDGDKRLEAGSLNNIGHIYASLGDNQQALEYYNQALSISKEIPDKNGQAITLNNIAAVYSSLGKKRQALTYYKQILPIFETLGYRRQKAIVLHNIASIHSDLGEKRQALELFNQALLLNREVKDKSAEAGNLNGIGKIYSDLEDKQQALKFYNQALPLRREVEDKSGEAVTLNNIGGVYSDLGDKQQALKFFNQALPLKREVEDKSGEAVTLNNIGSVYSDLAQKRKALKFYNQALSIAEQVEDKSLQATTINNIAGVHSYLGDKQLAFKTYNQALLLAREVEDKSEQATILSGIGGVYDDLANHQQALEFYKQALSLAEQVEDKTLQATSLINIGGVYSDLGDKQQALNLFNQALTLDRKAEHKNGEATTLNNIAAVYSDLGNNQQALKFYNQALLLSQEIEDKSQQATTLSNIGKVQNELGDKQKALDSFNKALLLSQEVEDKAQQAITLNNIGIVYNDLGNYKQALEFYNKALPIMQKIEDKSGEATTINNIASIYDSLEDKQRALTLYNRALPLKKEVADKSGEATILNNIGYVYYSLKDNQRALKFYNQALSLNREVEDKYGEAIALNNIGVVYFNLEDNRQALEKNNQALLLNREVGDKDGEANTLHNIAKIHREQGNLQTALTNIKAAVDIIENLRTKVDSNELRTSYFATVQDIYKLHIDILMQLHKQNPSLGYDAQALAASEKSRARGLLELLTEANADIRKGANPEFLAEEKRLQQLINSKEKLRLEIFSDKNKNNDPVSKAAAQRFKKEVENHINQLNQLKAKIKTSNPKYAALKYPEPLNLSKIQQQLDKDTVLLQYSLGEKRSYLWKVTPDSLDSYELPKSEQIETAAKKFRNVLQGVSSQGTGETATELSKLILAPVANKIGKKRLVIVADGALQNIPFAALTDLNSKAARDSKSLLNAIAQNKQRGIDVTPNNPSPQKTSNYQPLIINHEIVNLPSASTIAIQRQETAKRTTSATSIAILADPVFTANDSRITNKSSAQNGDYDSDINLSALNRSLNDINLNTITRLKGTREEAQGILKLFPQNNNLQAFDFEANYNWAVNPKLNKYRFIHFATHGFANSVNPELSGIVLSMVDKQGNKQKGFLRMHEIFNLDFPADLVVLSACQTALGKQVKGEGIVGLTRSLMYAGAERVALSLWDVDDAATSNLMQSFYQEMLQGSSPTAALRTAQLKMLKNSQWQNPYYWAAFTIQGEWK